MVNAVRQFGNFLIKGLISGAKYVRSNPFRTVVVTTDALGILANGARLIVDVTDAFGLDDNDKKLLTFLTDKGNMIDAKRIEVVNFEMYIDTLNNANKRFQDFSYEIQQLLIKTETDAQKIKTLSEQIYKKELPPYLKTYQEPKINTEQIKKEIQKIKNDYKNELSAEKLGWESLWMALSIGGAIWNFKTVRAYEHFAPYGDIPGARVLNFGGPLVKGIAQTAIPIMNLLSAYNFYTDCKDKFDQREQVRDRMKAMKDTLDKQESQLIILIDGYDREKNTNESLEGCYNLMKEAMGRDLTEEDKNILKKGLLKQRQDMYTNINNQIASTRELIRMMGEHAKLTQDLYKSQTAEKDYEKDRIKLEQIGEEIDRNQKEYQAIQLDKKGEKASKLINTMLDKCEEVKNILAKWSNEMESISSELLVIKFLNNEVDEIKIDKNENNDSAIKKSARRIEKNLEAVTLSKKVADKWTKEEIEKKIKEKLALHI